jgi:hypothetical protein
VLVLLGFVLRRERQKVLVRLVQWVFLQITSSSRFQICWVLPQRSLVYGGSKRSAVVSDLMVSLSWKKATVFGSFSLCYDFDTKRVSTVK